MKLRFWGVRGSIPSPGPDTVRYGGNTPCISLALSDDCTLVLDAGTGVHQLGKNAGAESHTYLFLLSHLHWDHIQGFPMFSPLMNPAVTIRILCSMNPAWAKHFLSQLDGIRFPVTVDEVAADVAGHADDMNILLRPYDVKVSRLQLNHRGECYGYRIDTPSGSVLYITDHEMDASRDVYTTFDKLAVFCSSADVLIHDSHFVNAQMPEMMGMGHSTVERACELAAKANAKQLILFHHAPGRTDEMLDANQALADSHLAGLGSDVRCTVASEGLSVDV